MREYFPKLLALTKNTLTFLIVEVQTLEGVYA